MPRQQQLLGKVHAANIAAVLIEEGAGCQVAESESAALDGHQEVGARIADQEFGGTWAEDEDQGADCRG